MALSFVHCPETVVFAVDLDSEMTSEAVPGCTRFDAVVHAITTFVSAKKRLDCAHTFGLMTLLDSAVFLPDSLTSSLDELLATLRSLAPSGATPRHETFDMGSLLHAAEEPKRLARQRGGLLRVLMVYGRSDCVPARPLGGLVAQHGGLALDCIYIHDKPSPGVNRPQDVYSALEDSVDDISAAAGHRAYVSETGGGNVKKLLTLMATMLAHPLQRRPQVELPPPVDLASAPLQVLPSERDAAPAAAAAAAGGPSAWPASTPAATAAQPLAASAGVRYAAAAAAGRPSSGGRASPAPQAAAIGGTIALGVPAAAPLPATADATGHRWGPPPAPAAGQWAAPGRPSSSGGAAAASSRFDDFATGLAPPSQRRPLSSPGPGTGAAAPPVAAAATAAAGRGLYAPPAGGAGSGSHPIPDLLQLDTDDEEHGATTRAPR